MNIVKCLICAEQSLIWELQYRSRGVLCSRKSLNKLLFISMKTMVFQNTRCADGTSVLIRIRISNLTLSFLRYGVKIVESIIDNDPRNRDHEQYYTSLGYSLTLQIYPGLDLS